MTFKSTLGAPLSEPECQHILDAWADLYHHALAVSAQPDAPEMLDYITDTIIKCWEVRRAISDGWYYANLRAFPPAQRVPPKAKTTALRNALSMLTEDQLNEVLDAINKGELK